MVPRRSVRRSRRHRLTRVGLVLALVTGPVLPLATTASAADAPAPVTAVAGPAVPGSSRTIDGPDVLADIYSVEDPPPTATSHLSVTVSPDPSLGIEAGDTVTMTFRGLPPGYQVTSFGMCPTTAPAQPDGSATPVSGSMCTGRWPTGIDSPIDDNGVTAALSTTKVGYPVYARTDGTATVSFLVGAGIVNTGTPVNYPRPGGGGIAPDTTVLCDADHACTIGFTVGIASGDFTTSALNWSDVASIPIRPGEPDTRSAAGCDGIGPSTLNAAGPERAQDPVSAWNSGLCATARQALPVSVVGQGEPDGLRALGDTADLTFAGSALLGSKDVPAATQPRVLTPVALNAVVLAEIGGIEVPSNSYPDGDTRQAPYPSGSPLTLPSIQLTQADVAKILVHDYTDQASSSTVQALSTSIRSHPGNGALAPFGPTGTSLPLSVAPTTVYPTGADSTPAALSAQLQHTSAADLVFPDLLSQDAGRAGTAVAPFTDFGSVVDARGAYTRQTSNVGGIYTAIFGKDSGAGVVSCPELNPAGDGAAARRSCAKFVVTDLVTARSLDLPVASIQNADGTFVEPGTASLQAAATQGTVAADNLFTAELDARGSAYPLTYVEYAVTQATPLRTADCATRPAAQEALTTLVSYLADGGQRALAPGLAPLTPALDAAAKASVAAIGATATTTGACAPKATTPTPTPTPAPSGPAGAGGLPPTFSSAVPDLSGGPGSAVPAADLPAVAAPAAQSPAPTATKDIATRAATITIPTFGAAGPLGAAAPLLGLAALVVLVSGAGVVASQRLRGKGFRQVAAWARATFVPTSGMHRLPGSGAVGA